MKKILYTMLLFSMILCLAVCAAAEEDPVILRVGEHRYTLSAVETYLNQNALAIVSAYEASGLDRKDLTEQYFIDSAVDYFVSRSVIEDKAAEWGLDTLTDQELELLRASAREKYEELWQQAREQLEEAYPGQEFTDAEITRSFEALGYDADTLYDEQLFFVLRARVADHCFPPEDVTDEEIREYYTVNYVEPDRLRYEGNVPLYEEEILYGGGGSAYVPEGMFYVKYIVLPLPPEGELTEEAAKAETALKDAEDALQTAYDTLARVAILGNTDQTAERDAYNRALSARDAARDRRDSAVAAITESLGDTVSEIRAHLSSGDSFESQIRLYSTEEDGGRDSDPGYLFHPESAVWTDEMKAVISPLGAAGDVSEPLYTENGILLFCRLEDLGKNGQYPLTDSDRELIRRMIQITDRLAPMIPEWASEYEIEADTSALRIYYDFD
ncbi:MAG: hypothetical protein Q4G19_03350 [Clostridia bacterium]|nr:hypothetical protein [Clostridia bacterium]